MATRSPTSRQKMRADGDRAKARASGGNLRKVEAAEPPGRSASAGGMATKGMVRNSANSRSSNSGRKHSS